MHGKPDNNSPHETQHTATMEIIEQSIIPKSPTAEPEDGIAITDDFIAVIDGSTGKTPNRVCPDASNGRYCMMLIRDYIYNNVYADITLRGFCEGITAYIRKQYGKSRLPYYESHPEERLTASAIVYSRHHKEIWMIGDCQCIANGTIHENSKPYEAVLARRRAAILRSLLREGRSIDELRADDTGRKAIIPEMIETMKNQNITYSVIDGFPIPMSKVKVIALAPHTQTIVLASDGYPFLMPTLSESEAALANQSDADPLNIYTFLATKAFVKGNNSFDDRTYIRFRT